MVPRAIGLDTDGHFHGIRSAEHSSGALGEAFAHFVAAAAYNPTMFEDGIFRYYKHIDVENHPDYADFVDPEKDDMRVSLLGGTAPGTLGGMNAWTKNQCTNDWATPLQPGTAGVEVTTALDWLRFWWQFMASGDTGLGPKPTFADVVDLNGGGPIEEVEIKGNEALPEAHIHEVLDAIGTVSRDVCANEDGDWETCMCRPGA